MHTAKQTCAKLIEMGRITSSPSAIEFSQAFIYISAYSHYWIKGKLAVFY